MSTLEAKSGIGNALRISFSVAQIAREPKKKIQTENLAIGDSGIIGFS